MQVTIQGKQIDLGDALRTHVEDRLEEINTKFFNHAAHATVTFSREGHGHGLIRAHVSFHVGKDIHIISDAVESSARLSFDTAADKAARQLRRYKDRLRGHHERLERAALHETIQARDYVLSSDDDKPQGDAPVIIAEMTTDIQTMSVSEAVMRMDLAGQTALLFRNASHNGLNMVYRRPDGNVGWIDPEMKAVQTKTGRKATG